MTLWRNSRFWTCFIVFLVPSALVFSLPGVMFIHPDTGLLVGCTIFGCQAILTFGVPYLIARRIVLQRLDSRRGFPVIQKSDGNRTAE